MTVIEVLHRGRTRRCDSRCHRSHAPASRCVCVCGGRYHGTVWEPGGLNRAMLQTRETVITSGREQWGERFHHAAGVQLELIYF